MTTPTQSPRQQPDDFPPAPRADLASDRRGRKRFAVEATLFLSYFVFGLSWIGYSPFLREIQAELGLSHANAGLLISSVSFAKIFMPFLTGLFAVRLGIHRSLAVGMLLICASLATPFIHGFWGIMASRFVFGVGGAMVVTLMGSVVLQWFGPTELPIVNAFNYVAVNSGITLTLFMTPALSEHFGRRSTLLGYALLSVAIFLAWTALVRGGDWRSTRSGAKESGGYVEILRMKETWLLTFAAAGPLAVYLVFNTWLPTYYAQIFSMSKIEASRLTGLANLVGIPTAILGGVLTQRLPRRKPLILISGLIVGFASFGLFLSTSLAVVSTSAVLFGIGLFLWISPLSTLGMELKGMTPRKLAMLNGVYYSIGYVFAFFAPMITGALRDSTGSFVPGFALFAAGAWSLFAAGVMLPETGRSRGTSGETAPPRIPWGKPPLAPQTSET